MTFQHAYQIQSQILGSYILQRPLSASKWEDMNLTLYLQVMGGSRGGGDRGVQTPPEKSQKYRVSLQYWSGSPEKSQSYQASIQCWAIIGLPAKRQMVFCWRADDGPFIMVFVSSIALSTKKTKKNIKFGLPLKKLSRSAHTSVI